MAKAFSPPPLDLGAAAESAADAQDAGALPLVLLGLDLKLLCVKCGTRLIMDARLQGRELDCPHCGTRVVVPRYLDGLSRADESRRADSAAGIVAALSQLSDAEIAFLSEPDSSPPPAAPEAVGRNG